MNIGKLPPFMAMTLGLLGCEAGMNVCLSSYNGPYDYTTGDLDTDNPMLSSTGIVSGTLGQTETSADSGSGTDTESTVTGPCLSAPMDSSGTETDTGTGTGTDTGTDTDASSGTEGSSTEGSSSDGSMLDEPPPPQARAAAVERVVSREILPADVLDRLRALVSKAKG
jgi:hypothetical protein